MFQIGEEAACGPWRIVLEQVLSGDAAANAARSWNAGNPDAPEGLHYLVGTMRITNVGAVDRIVTVADFAATGDDGILRRPASIPTGDQGLPGTIPAGTTERGGLPFLVDAPDRAVVWFDSTLLGGSWANATFATSSAAVVPVFASGSTIDAAVGEDPDAPAMFDETVVCGDWEVTLHEVIEGQAVLDRSGPELQALARSAAGKADIPNWYAVRGTIRNHTSETLTFSPTALQIADAEGDAWDHILALYPPRPDLSVTLLPGALHEGWAAFSRMSYGTGYSDVSLIRVQPSPLVDAPRFIAPPAGVTAIPEGDDATPDDTEEFGVGDIVVTTETQVNLRATPSTRGDIVEELDEGVRLEVVGTPQEADGHTWIEVRVVDGDGTGFVVLDFVTLEA